MRIHTLMPVPSEISTSPERRTQCLMYYRDIGQRKLLLEVGDGGGGIGRCNTYISYILDVIFFCDDERTTTRIIVN